MQTNRATQPNSLTQLNGKTQQCRIPYPNRDTAKDGSPVRIIQTPLGFAPLWQILG